MMMLQVKTVKSLSVHHLNSRILLPFTHTGHVVNRKQIGDSSLSLSYTKYS